jgi:glutathione S-transferase/RNA polymerase-associated protein
MALRLYANSLSPFVRKVRITLYEKGAEFDTVEIERGAQRDELLRVSPRGEVPALVDGDTVVTGSATICDYLEDVLPRPALLPAAPAARARCRALEHVADTQTDALQFLCFLLAVRRPELRDERPEVPAALAEAVHRHFAYVDRELAGREWLVDDFSRADVAFVPHVTSLAYVGERIPDACGRLRGWIDRMRRRPSVERDAAQAMAAWERMRGSDDPFFRADRIHWRGERVEWAVRLGLGAWLGREVEAGRAYFSPRPGDV